MWTRWTHAGLWVTMFDRVCLVFILFMHLSIPYRIPRQKYVKVKKVKADIALHGNHISELRDVTCRMGSHSVTCHPTQVNAPRLTPAMQAGTRFTYPGGMEGWVDLVDLIAARPRVEPAIFRSRVRRRTVAPPRQPFFCKTSRFSASMQTIFMWGQEIFWRG